jgi:hypothetical protein
MEQRTTLAVVEKVPEGNVSEKFPLFAVTVPPPGGTDVAGVVQFTATGVGVAEGVAVAVGVAVGVGVGVGFGVAVGVAEAVPVGDAVGAVVGVPELPLMGATDVPAFPQAVSPTAPAQNATTAPPRWSLTKGIPKVVSPSIARTPYISLGAYPALVSLTMWPILFPSFSVNHMPPSEPRAMPNGRTVPSGICVGVGHSLTVPVAVIRPIALAFNANHMAPSGPSAMPFE